MTNHPARAVQFGTAQTWPVTHSGPGYHLRNGSTEVIVPVARIRRGLSRPCGRRREAARELVGTILRTAGASVQTASPVREALQLSKSGRRTCCYLIGSRPELIRLYWRTRADCQTET
jgi:hypothetical protein